MISPSRRVSVPLWIGIVLLPVIFAWFTLRRGHSVPARLIAFVWLACTLAFGLITTVAAPPPPSEVWALPR